MQYFYASLTGKVPMKVTPFKNLKVEEIRSELRSRQLYDNLDCTKPILQEELRTILKGVHRVPTLLLTNPTQPLSELNLHRYTILNSEPLHDLKGHLSNLLMEIPHLLENSHKKCKQFMTATFGEKVSGADMRAGVIHLSLLLKKLGVQQVVQDLLDTIIRIGEILYADDSKRTPQRILALYNNAWKHMELCRELIASPKQLTTTKMFGTYLHALTVHAPVQYEIMSQKSINTENQERLFGQSRRAAEATSNRHKSNVISTIILRLQAKKEVGQILASVDIANSQVSRAASNLAPFQNTTITTAFIANRKKSWQAHLERISPYLLEGEGAWWKKAPEGYLFFDTDFETEAPTSPPLLHFRHADLTDVTRRQQQSWQKCLESGTSLPALSVDIYHNGTRINTRNLSPPPTSTCIQDNHMESINPSSRCNNDDTECYQIDSNSPVDYATQCSIDLTEGTTERACASGIHSATIPTPMDTGPHFKTTSATNILKVIPTSQLDTLVVYDSLRARLKSKQPCLETDRNKYQAVSCTLKSIVASRRLHLKNEIRTTQTQYYTEHGRIPTTDECEQLRKLVKLRDIASKLLTTWDKL